jgi:hypothetical protein
MGCKSSKQGRLDAYGQKIADLLDTDHADVMVEDFGYTVHQLKTNTELDISDKKLRVQHAHAVAAVIKKNTSLLSLNLAGNDFKEEGAKIIAEALKVLYCKMPVDYR